MLVDSHCHLDMPAFAEDLEAVIARADATGVGRMVTICTRLDGFPAVLAIAEEFSQIFCSLGVHPHEVATTEEEITAEALLHRTQHPKVVAIGETGLDYHYEHSPREAQQRAFRAHIAAARESGLPLVIHSRAADADMEAILREETDKGAFPAVLHCFSSGRALAMAAVDLGIYVSLSGIVTFAKAEELRAIVAELPVELLLVETDAPYLAPVPQRGKRNEPAFVVHTAACAAKLLGMGEGEFARRSSENFHRLFSRVPRRDAP